MRLFSGGPFYLFGVLSYCKHLPIVRHNRPFICGDCCSCFVTNFIRDLIVGTLLVLLHSTIHHTDMLTDALIDTMMMSSTTEQTVSFDCVTAIEHEY